MDEIPQLVSIPFHTENVKPVPITIISGFLGAGKSTLINGILKENHGFKIAVIVNEFGDSGDIEKEILLNDNGTTNTDILELQNGCICCSLKYFPFTDPRDSGVQAIENLMKKRGNFDFIVLEMSGMGDPGEMAKTFWMDSALQSGVYLDAVVTVLDSLNCQFSSLEQKQIGMADICIINKIDLVPDLSMVQSKVLSVNPLCEIYKTSFSKIDYALLFDRNFFALGKDLKFLEKAIKPSLNTICIKRDFLNVQKAKLWIQWLLWESNYSIWRLKAILSDHEASFIIQGVYDLLDELSIDKKESSKIVVIGENIKLEEIEASFVSFCE